MRRPSKPNGATVALANPNPSTLSHLLYFSLDSIVLVSRSMASSTLMMSCNTSLYISWTSLSFPSSMPWAVLAALTSAGRRKGHKQVSQVLERTYRTILTSVVCVDLSSKEIIIHPGRYKNWPSISSTLAVIWRYSSRRCVGAPKSISARHNFMMYFWRLRVSAMWMVILISSSIRDRPKAINLLLEARLYLGRLGVRPSFSGVPVPLSWFETRPDRVPGVPAKAPRRIEASTRLARVSCDLF